MARIHVIGIDGSGLLAERAFLALRRSPAILTSGRLRDAFSKYDGYASVKEKLRVVDDMDETIRLLGEATEEVSVIASGDPMFFGIGGRIVEAFPDAEIYPALSSVQLAFSRLRLPWHDAFFVSLHGSVKRDWGIEDVPLLAERHRKLAILTGGENTPERISRALPSGARVFVLERLGFEDETVKEGSPEEISRMSFRIPNLMVVVRGPGEGIAFGLNEEDFIHDKGLLTKDEVRAVALHKLRLPMKGVLWDIGAGSGSVSIEAKRLCPALDVYSIEKDPAREEHIRENSVSLRAGRIHIVPGEAPSALEGLPAPDRAFVGGAGRGLPSVVGHILKNMGKGIVVVSAITLESLHEALEAFRAQGLEPQALSISVSRSRPIEGREYLKALNQVFLIKAEK